jgi:hypothetical protein
MSTSKHLLIHMGLNRIMEGGTWRILFSEHAFH